MQTGIVSRGFSVGANPADVRLPPGAVLITEFFCLSAATRVPLDRWEFTNDRGTAPTFCGWDWKLFRGLARETITFALRSGRRHLPMRRDA